MLARLHLQTHLDFATYGIPTELSATAVWSDMASYLALAGAEYHLGGHERSTTTIPVLADEDRQFYTALNAYFRALLVTTVVYRRALAGAGRIHSMKESEWYPLLQLNCARVERALIAADVPATVKAFLSAWNKKRWNLQPRIAGSPPALHP